MVTDSLVNRCVLRRKLADTADSYPGRNVTNVRNLTEQRLAGRKTARKAQAAFARLVRIAVGPEDGERIDSVEDAPGVRMVEATVAGDRLGELPRPPGVVARVERHLAAGPPRLRAGRGRADHAPAVAFDE